MDTISRDELVELRESGADFYLVNVLSVQQFEEGHIPGSICIPLDHLEDVAPDKFEEDDTIVVYCASESCQASPKAAELLEDLGFTDVRDYEEGFKGWKEAGMDVESG